MYTMSLDKVQTVTTTQETPDAPISAEPTSTEFCHTLVHHYDFFGNPLFHKCAAPPATSLAIIMSRKRGNLDFDNSLHNAIVLWNALELIEPVVFWGPIYAIQDQQGTKLKEAATGQCSKLYATEGPWLNDEYDAAENKPFGYQDITDSDVVLNGSETKDPLGIAPPPTSFYGGWRARTRIPTRRTPAWQRPRDAGRSAGLARDSARSCTPTMTTVERSTSTSTRRIIIYGSKHSTQIHLHWHFACHSHLA